MIVTLAVAGVMRVNPVVGLERVTVKLSSASPGPSSTNATLTLFVVCPAKKVMVPFVWTKSFPAVAEPAIV